MGRRHGKRDILSGYMASIMPRMGGRINKALQKEQLCITREDRSGLLVTLLFVSLRPDDVIHERPSLNRCRDVGATAFI